MNTRLKLPRFHQFFHAGSCVILLASLAAGAPVGPLDDNGVLERVFTAPEEEQEDAHVLFAGHYFQSDEAGRITRRFQRLVRVHTEFALEHVADPRIAFDSSRQQLTVHAARTYWPDGRYLDSPANAFNEITPGAVSLAVDHLQLHEMVVTHAGLEPGVSIWLDYTLEDLSPPVIPWQSILFPHGEFPTLEMEVLCTGLTQGSLVNAEGMIFSLQDPYAEESPWPETAHWQFHDLPARPVGVTYRLGDQLPWIALSRGQQHWDTFVDLIDVSARAREDLAADLAELREKQGPWLSKREALEAIAAFAKERTALLRYHPWEFTALPRPVARVLETSYATPAERCALILACCQIEGIELSVLPTERWQAAMLGEGFKLLPAMTDPVLHGGGGEEKWWIDPVHGEIASTPYFRDEILRASGAHWWTRRDEDNISLRCFWDLNEGVLKVDGRVQGQATARLDLDQPESFLAEWIEGLGM